MPKRKLKFANTGLPLRGNSNKKAAVDVGKFRYNKNFGSPLSPKPLVSDVAGNPVDINLQLRQASDKGGGVKVKQKKLSSEFSSTQPKSSTTTTPSVSTTTAESTSPATSSYTKTTSTSTNNNNNGETMAYRGRKNNKDSSSYFTPNTVGFNGPEVPGASDFRKNDDGSMIGLIYGDGEPKKVDFNLQLLCTNYLNDYETSDVSSSEVRPKLILRASSFADQIYDAKNNPTNNVELYNSLQAIYKKFDADVGNSLNSYTSPNWTFNNFVDGLYDIMKAHEWFYFLDSILAQDSGTMGTDNISRVSQQYKDMFTSNSTLVNARATLRSFLKGAWLPPNFAQMIRWFYQGYKVNPLQQSTVFRYIPSTDLFVNSSTANTFLGTPSLTTIIDYLKPGTSAAKISTILNKVYPNGKLTSFPKSCSDNVYDVLMYEIFANECIGFQDTNSSNAQAWWPMSYATTVNDLPYFMDADPIPSLNGLAYALQTIPTAKSATTGYTPTHFAGIRKPLAATMKDIGGNNNKSNLQIVANSSGGILGYSMTNAGNKRFIDAYVAHTACFHYGGSTTLELITRSQAPANMQRVYFNNANGPKLLMNDLVNKLFHTKA